MLPAVSNFRSLFEDVSQLVEDIIDTESRIVSYNLPKPKYPKLIAPALNLNSDLLLPDTISEKVRITMEERMPPRYTPTYLPNQIPKIKASKLKQRRRRSRRIKSIDPLKEFLEEQYMYVAPPTSKPIPCRTIQSPPSPNTEPIELCFDNPFLSDDCCLDDDLEDLPPVPLTMYSYFQFPLEEELDSYPSDDCTLSDYSELDSLCSTSSSSSSSSSENESYLSPTPTPSNLCHLAAYNPTHSDISLSPRFLLRLNRDKLVAGMEQRDRAYLVTYASQLLESRSQNPTFTNEVELTYSSGSYPLFSDENQNLPFTGYLRDLNGISIPLTKQEMYAKEERKVTLKHLDHFVKGRDIRGNSLGWLMLSLEFRMINSNKIVRPLKSRAYLPKRLQEFSRVVSPLKNEIKMT